MTTVSEHIWRTRQQRLNTWTHKYLVGVPPLQLDGKPGYVTEKRIKNAKWWLGYGVRDDKWDDLLDYRLRHTYYRTKTSYRQILRGLKRRRAHNKAWRNSHHRPISGLEYYDGVHVAAWMVPYLNYARKNGWHGRLVSGYRDPAYSEHLCYAMCGQPSCPGRCAGRSSNHVGSVLPHGAVDVTDYWTFGSLMKKCPLQPRIFNALPSDPVHFSSTGR